MRKLGRLRGAFPQGDLRMQKVLLQRTRVRRLQGILEGAVWRRNQGDPLGYSANRGHDLWLYGSVPSFLRDGAILDPELDCGSVRVQGSPTAFQFAKIEHLIVRR